MDLYVFHSVKGIIAHKLKITDHHILAVHGKIVTLCLDMIHLHVTTAPECFEPIWKIHIIQHYAPTAAEVFRSFNERPLDRNILGIPNTCPRHFEPGTVLRINLPAVPKRIFPLKYGGIK